MTAIIKNKWLLQLRGLVLISSGVVLFVTTQNYYKYQPLLFSALLVLSGSLGIWFVSDNKIEQVRRGWLIVESSVEIIFSIVIVYLYFKSEDIMSDFITTFALFSFFLSFNQLINVFRVFILGVIPNIQIILASVAVALAYGIFAVLIMAKESSLESSIIIRFIGIGPLSAGILTFFLCDRLYVVKE